MNPKELQSFMSGDSPNDQILNSVYEIENILILLKEINDKIQFYKDLKKFRTDSINDKISDYNERSSRLRQLIMNTLSNFDEKNLDFPGIGKVGRRRGSNSWVVDDEKSLLEFFEKEGRKREITEIKEVINKREVNKLVEQYNAQNVSVPGITKRPAEESLTVSFHKEEEKKVSSQDVDHSTSLDALEELEL